MKMKNEYYNSLKIYKSTTITIGLLWFLSDHLESNQVFVDPNNAYFQAYSDLLKTFNILDF
jgi:hypothetical protein